MCYDPMTMTIAAVAIGAGQIYQGYQANQAAKAQASAIEKQAQIAREEAEFKAQQGETQRRKFLAEQRMAYLASGVSLEGTPLIIGEETWKEFTNEINAIRKSGAAQSEYLMTEAQTTRNTGRAQLIGSIFEGVGTAALGAYKSGAFSSAKTVTAKSSTMTSQTFAKNLIYGTN
jgi:hypothetical protein